MESINTNTTSKSLIVIYGVPGSGKSYLSSKLEEYFASQKNDKTDKTEKIDPDLIELELLKNSTGSNNFNKEIWLEARNIGH